VTNTKQFDIWNPFRSTIKAMHEAYNVSCPHSLRVVVMRCARYCRIQQQRISRDRLLLYELELNMTVLSIRLCRTLTMASLKQLGHWMADIYFSSPLPLRIVIFHKRWDEKKKESTKMRRKRKMEIDNGQQSEGKIKRFIYILYSRQIQYSQSYKKQLQKLSRDAHRPSPRQVMHCGPIDVVVVVVVVTAVKQATIK